MKSSMFGLACAFCWVLVGCSDGPARNVDPGRDAGAGGADAGGADAQVDAATDDRRARVEAAFAEASGFSGAVLVRHQGEVLLDAAAGLADRDAGRVNETSTVFDIGSLTKQVTGAAVVALEEEGRLGFEDRLDLHFSDVPPDKAGITIHQLLTHTGGFTGGLGPDEEVVGRDEYLARAWASQLIRDPGTEYAYSNVGYSILAAIVEKTTNASYEDVLRERLFDPAEMVSTGYVRPAWPVGRLARGYFGPIGILPTDAPWDTDGPYWNLRGNGGLLSDTKDMLRWHDALAGSGVLSEGGLTAYQTPYVDEGGGTTFYAYGWVVEETPAGTLLWHDGGNGFFFAEMLRFIDEDLVIVMLSNEENDASLSLSRQLAAAVAPSLEVWALFRS